MEKKHITKGIFGLCSAVIPGVLFLFVPSLLSGHQIWSEYYSRNIFPLISWPFEFLSSQFPVSLTEIFVVFAAASFVFWVAWLIYRFIQSVHKCVFLYRLIFIAAIIFSVISISFTLLLGINYTRIPLNMTLSLDSPQRSPEELAEATVWLSQMMQETRDGLQEDSNGCMLLSTSLSQSLSDGSRAMDAAALSFPVLSGTTVLAKPVALSHYWSYTGITGMYFPFFGEANINVDMPDSQIPLIICHEISHTRGIAREQDANLAGFLACIYSDRKDFQYCAYQYVFLYCAWDLSIADETAYSKIAAMIPDSIRRDWEQNAAYWAQFEGPVQETSTQINDSYLQANLQEEGVKNYNRVTDLIVDYYFTYVKGN